VRPTLGAAARQGCSLCRPPAAALALAAVVLVSQGCPTPNNGIDASLPEFEGDPLEVGALLCVNSPFTARASSLEHAAILAEDYINGSTRAFPDVPADEIPCRAIHDARGQHTCGVWVGADADGNPIRGPLKVVLADSEDRVDRGVSAAHALVDNYGVSTIIGSCTTDVMHAVFERVTQKETVLISPTVTADSISKLDDRTAEDVAAGLSGYVSRTITPDYIQARMMAILGGNRTRPEPLIRWDDQRPDDCTEQPPTYCANKHSDLGAAGGCLASVHSAEPEKVFFRYSNTGCAGVSDPAKFCEESEGNNYECRADPESGEQVCAQWKSRRWCTKVVKPQTAMILYQEAPFGRGLYEMLSNAWVDLYDMHVLSSNAYDPKDPESFGDAVEQLFTSGAATFDERMDGGLITDTTLTFGDSVVFLCAEATDGALILQEWRMRSSSLPGGGREVFWVAPDPVRNPLLSNQVNFDTIKNLYVTDPGTLDPNRKEFFHQLWHDRWRDVAQGDFAGNVFDAVLLAALALDRAGFSRMAASGGQALGPSDGAWVKEGVREVSAGCRKERSSDPCLGTPPVVYGPASYADAVRTLGQGLAVRLMGVTGDLSLSPAGDRLAEFAVWKTMQSKDNPSRGMFFDYSNLSPGAFGILLDY